MHDFGRIDRQGGTPLAILVRNRLEDLPQLSQSLFPRGHERIAALNRGNLRYPALRFIAIQEYFVFIETHAPRFYYLGRIRTERPLAAANISHGRKPANSRNGLTDEAFHAEIWSLNP